MSAAASSFGAASELNREVGEMAMCKSRKIMLAMKSRPAFQRLKQPEGAARGNQYRAATGNVATRAEKAAKILRAWHSACIASSFRNGWRLRRAVHEKSVKLNQQSRPRLARLKGWRKSKARPRSGNGGSRASRRNGPEFFAYAYYLRKAVELAPLGRARGAKCRWRAALAHVKGAIVGKKRPGIIVAAVDRRAVEKNGERGIVMKRRMH